MTEEECRQIKESLGEIIRTLSMVQQVVARLENQVSNEAALCPFRESISRSSNNGVRLALAETRVDHVEEKMHILELQFAKAGIISGAAGGGIFSAVGLIVFTIGKSAGWW
jgi:hypothetical protein